MESTHWPVTFADDVVYQQRVSVIRQFEWQERIDVIITWHGYLRAKYTRVIIGIAIYLFTIHMKARSIASCHMNEPFDDIL